MDKTPEAKEISAKNAQEQVLWFLAILPPADVADRVRAVQQEIADRFGPHKILKIPVHVTLEAPFRLDEEGAARMTEHLRDFFAKQPAFSLELRNFGTFRHSVVFIEVVPNLTLLELHEHTSALLREEHAYIKERSWQQGYTPHVTVANRDVTPPAHRAIWGEFNTRKFYAKFAVNEIHLLRHTPVAEHSVNMWLSHARFPLLPVTDEKIP